LNLETGDKNADMNEAVPIDGFFALSGGTGAVGVYGENGSFSLSGIKFSDRFVHGGVHMLRLHGMCAIGAESLFFINKAVTDSGFCENNRRMFGVSFNLLTKLHYVKPEIL